MENWLSEWVGGAVCAGWGTGTLLAVFGLMCKWTAVPQRDDDLAACVTAVNWVQCSGGGQWKQAALVSAATYRRGHKTWSWKR